MPLPNSSIKWPPDRDSGHREDMREFSTWYSGDVDALTGFYQAIQPKARPVQYETGVRGRVARWWWGVPTAPGERPAKLHVPLAADLCQTSADLLFSESINLSSESASMQEFLDALQDGGLDTRLHEAAEVVAALGGGYLRTVWDENVSRLPWTDAVHADMGVPEFRGGRLVAVTFWQRLTSTDSTVWRLLERHESGLIEHGLYHGTGDELGRRVPLAEHPEAEYLAPLVNADSQQPTGTNRLTATYVPNMLPNRVHRGSRQGRSDLDGLLPMLDALDEAYSSWQRDIRHAKSRIHVPASYIDSQTPGQPGILDIDKEVYVPIQGVLAGRDGMDIDVQQFKIRFEEHSQTVTEWTKRIIESAGYSTQSLTDADGAALTATEVRARERRSYMTRGKKIRYWTAALVDHLTTQAEVANANLSAGLVLDDIKVEFPDGVQDSTMELAQTAAALRAAEAASTETLVRYVHPDWDDEQVQTETDLILSETGASAPQPVADPTQPTDPGADLVDGGLPGDVGA